MHGHHVRDALDELAIGGFGIGKIQGVFGGMRWGGGGSGSTTPYPGVGCGGTFGTRTDAVGAADTVGIGGSGFVALEPEALGVDVGVAVTVAVIVGTGADASTCVSGPIGVSVFLVSGVQDDAAAAVTAAIERSHSARSRVRPRAAEGASAFARSASSPGTSTSGCFIRGSISWKPPRLFNC
jgi:hypothetical protein